MDIFGTRAHIEAMPKLWTETIDAHRRAVRDATLDATATLVSNHGLASVTMSRIAEAAGIGRATLYKYFPDIEAILFAWHERQIDHHLRYLAEVRERASNPAESLAAVLEAYAYILHGHHGAGPHSALLHQGEHVVQARNKLRDMLCDLLAEAADAGDIRNDVAPEELAGFCLHALTAASELKSKSAVRRLVDMTLAGLRSPH